MNILHCIIQYFPAYIGGTEVYTHTLAKLQQEAGHTVAVAVPYIDYYNPGGINKEYVYDGITVYQFLEPGHPHNHNLYLGKVKPAGLENFKELLLAFKPDVVHFHEINLGNSYSVHHLQVAASFGAKVVMTMHLSFLVCNSGVLIKKGKPCDGVIRTHTCSACSYHTFYKIPWPLAHVLSATAQLSTGIVNRLPKGKLKTLLSMPLVIQRKKNDLHTTLKYVQRLVAVSYWYREMLLRNGVPADKLTVIPQALPFTAMPVIDKPMAANRLPLKIIFIGRIQPQKGVDILLSAVEYFTKVEVVVDIYGRKEDTDYYRQFETKANAMEQVRFCGILTRDELLPTIAKYDILCLPSTITEMAPLVIQEAFAAGIPVLASRVYGNKELIQHKVNGLLFDILSVNDLRQQINELVHSPQLIDSLKKHITAPFLFNAVHQQYMEVYTAA